MPKKIDVELKARAVRLVSEHGQEYPTLTAACAAVARQLGIGAESVRRWYRQSEVEEDGCVLVRPDMYVGWRAKEAMSQSSNVLLDVFAKLLGRGDRAARGAAASAAASAAAE